MGDPEHRPGGKRDRVGERNVSKQLRKKDFMHHRGKRKGCNYYPIITFSFRFETRTTDP